MYVNGSTLITRYGKPVEQIASRSGWHSTLQEPLPCFRQADGRSSEFDGRINRCKLDSAAMTSVVIWRERELIDGEALRAGWDDHPAIAPATT
jgi:hypothetical protein